MDCNSILTISVTRMCNQEFYLDPLATLDPKDIKISPAISDLLTRLLSIANTASQLENVGQYFNVSKVRAVYVYVLIYI